MDADTARLLISEGLELLASLPPYVEAESLALGTRLREAGHAPELVAAVLTQARLRQRAVAKFGQDADRMLFTPDGLEQATRAPVAARHAARFTEAGPTCVHDLGCGLGADAIALARAGLHVEAVDLDEATALLAGHNLAALMPEAFADRPAVTHGTAEEVVPRDGEAVWFDPARRTPGRTDARGRTRRTFRLEDMSPRWEHVRAVAAIVPTGAKLAPAFPHSALADEPGVEAEWVSISGDLVECAVWWPGLARTPGRVATVLDADGGLVARLEEAEAPDIPPGLLYPAPGLALYEPDLAVLQAGLVGALAAATDGSELAAGVGYVVAESDIEVLYARRSTIAEVLPAAPKAVKAWARGRDITGATIKRRGGRLDPEEFRRRAGLTTKGGDQVTLLLTDTSTGPTCLVLDRG